MKTAFGLILMVGSCLGMALMADAKTIYFSGFEWKVREGFGAPAKNHWRRDNAWLDENGHLHLKIRKEGGIWTCAELQTTQEFLYGKFTFELGGGLETLDKNIVLGIFHYPQEKFRDGFDEIDIEFSRWGKEENPNASFTVYSDAKAFVENPHRFIFSDEGQDSIHSFSRAPESVQFQSFLSGSEGPSYQWRLIGADISKKPMPLYLNFWLFRNMPPSDGQEYEIIVKKISFQKFS